MANDKKKPWGRVYAVIPNQVRSDDDSQKSQWVELGVAWLNENPETGKTNMRVQLNVEPIAWRDPHCPRTIEIQKSEEPSARKPGAR